MTDDPTTDVPLTLQPVTAPSGSTPQRPQTSGRGGGSGVILAMLVLMVVVFAAGLTIGQGFGSQNAAATPTAVAVASPTPTPIATATEVPSPNDVPTGSADGTPSPTPAPTATTASPTPAPTATASGPVATVPPNAPADFGLFWQALQLVRDNYVDRDDLTDQQLTYGAIQGMVEALGDTGHSVFMTPEDVAADADSLGGTITGIGAILGERDGRAIIVSVISGAPADRAGLRSGDFIIAVDGQSVARLTTEQIVGKVRGEAGTRVVITIQHDTDAPIDVSMTRERISVPAVTWALIPGTQIADVRLIQFSTGAAEALRVALRAAIDGGAESVILDMRSNPGGLVDEAIGVASQFLANGVVYQRQDATGAQAPVDVRPGGIATALPVVVLVDEGTASSAEIVAGALQDNGRAEIIGTTTFGTGTVLNQFPLADGSAVRLGVEHWLTPDGVLIFGNGIEPDETVELAAGASFLEPGEVEDLTPEQFAASSDTQLQRAVEILGEVAGQ